MPLCVSQSSSIVSFFLFSLLLNFFLSFFSNFSLLCEGLFFSNVGMGVGVGVVGHQLRGHAVGVVGHQLYGSCRGGG